MIDTIDLQISSENLLTYGGMAGKKKGITIHGENYIIKYTKSLKDRKNTVLSYSNAPICEYIGSHIYNILGINSHKTYLPVENSIHSDKMVICKDFTDIPNIILTEFREFRATDNNDPYEEKYPTNGRGTEFTDILYTIDNHQVLNIIPNIKEHFWKMFVVDAIIGNGDRNNGNWGVLVDATKGKLPVKIAPIYDNGACFYPSWDENKMIKYLSDKDLFNTIAYKGFSNCYIRNGHRLNPFHVIMEKQHIECNEIVCKISENFPFQTIYEMIDELVDNQRLSSIYGTFIKNLIDSRMNNILLPVAEEIIREDDSPKP